MGGILQVDTIQNNNASTIITQTNTTTLTFGSSGQTIVIPSGTTFNASSASVNLPSINLATGVTGTLPIANGGTGTTSTTFANLATNVTGTLPATNGGTGNASFTTGDLLYASNATTLTKLAVGTSTQVLGVSAGAPAWTTPNSGAFVFLAETSASNVASVDLNGYFTSTYDYYVIYIDDHYGSVSNQTCMQFATTESYTVQTSSYYSGGIYVASDNTAAGPSSNAYWNQNRLLINATVSTTSTQVANTVVTIYNPMGSNVKTFTSQFSNADGNISNIYNGSGGGRWNSTTAITGVRFLQISGNITARKIRMYGIKNS